MRVYRWIRRTWKSVVEWFPHMRHLATIVATALLLYCILLGGMTGNERQNRARFQQLREEHRRHVEADRLRRHEREEHQRDWLRRQKEMIGNKARG